MVASAFDADFAACGFVQMEELLGEPITVNGVEATAVCEPEADVEHAYEDGRGNLRRCAFTFAENEAIAAEVGAAIVWGDVVWTAQQVTVESGQVTVMAAAYEQTERSKSGYRVPR